MWGYCFGYGYGYDYGYVHGYVNELGLISPPNRGATRFGVKTKNLTVIPRNQWVSAEVTTLSAFRIGWHLGRGRGMAIQGFIIPDVGMREKRFTLSSWVDGLDGGGYANLEIILPGGIGIGASSVFGADLYTVRFGLSLSL